MQAGTYLEVRKTLILDYAKFPPQFSGTHAPLNVVAVGEEENFGALQSVSKSVLLKYGLRTSGSESTGGYSLKMRCSSPSLWL